MYWHSTSRVRVKTVLQPSIRPHNRRKVLSEMWLRVDFSISTANAEKSLRVTNVRPNCFSTACFSVVISGVLVSIAIFNFPFLVVRYALINVINFTCFSELSFSQKQPLFIILPIFFIKRAEKSRFCAAFLACVINSLLGLQLLFYKISEFFGLKCALGLNFNTL